MPPGFYAQERIDGVPASIVFVAAGGRAVPLGVSRQLIGEAAFGAPAIDTAAMCSRRQTMHVLTDAVVESAIALASYVAEQFGLVGLNGIDFIVRDDVPYAIEVNPRWSASMELVERHVRRVDVRRARGGVRGRRAAGVRSPSARRGRSAIGKAIVFAREDAHRGDTRVVAWTTRR